MYFSDSREYFDRHDSSALIWQGNLTYDWNEQNNIGKDFSFPPTKACRSHRYLSSNKYLFQELLNNGSLFAHTFFVKKGKTIDSPTPSDVIYGVHGTLPSPSIVIN